MMHIPRLLNDRLSPHSEYEVVRHGVENTLRATIDNLPSPSCIALYGTWGQGKSTILRRVCREYQKGHGGCAFLFNPWEHESQGNLLPALLRGLVRAAGTESWASDKKELLARVTRTVLSLGMTLLAGRFANIEVSPEKVIGSLDRWNQYQDSVDGLKEDFRRLIDIILEGTQESRFVFFLDDLDRCLPESVVQVLEGIKLLMCGDTQCRAIFVFALDRTAVGEAIAKRYGYATAYFGETYLEKIFDFSVEVPAFSGPDVGAVLEKALAATGRSHGDAFLEPIGGPSLLGSVLQHPAFANPRVAKRVTNRVLVFVSDSGNRTWCEQLPADKKSRLLQWIAGAERFRAFRELVFTAPEDDLVTMVHSIDKHVPFQGDYQLRRLTEIPGFSGYLVLIGVAGLTRPVLCRERDAGAVGSLKYLDERLRASGL